MRRSVDVAVTGPPQVAAALTARGLSVVPDGPPSGAAQLLQRRMARFSDGADHRRRRALVERLLPPVAGLEDAAAAHTAQLVRPRVDPFDAMPLARTVPAAVLARALGVTDVATVTAAVGTLADALAPWAGPPRRGIDGDAAAETLATALGGEGERVAAQVGVLLQTRDATAALIGAAVLAGDRVGHHDDPVDRVLRHDPPVRWTRRVAVSDVDLHGLTVPAGSVVSVGLAAAEQGPPHPAATFGHGPHACPGAAHAVALARGVLAGLRARGWRAVPDQVVEYEPRPNLRMPARVLVELA